MADLPVTHVPPPTKITILISGSGTNLQALIDATTSGLIPSTTIVRVICNVETAYGLKRAQKANIPTTYHNLYKGGYCKWGEKDEVVKQKAREKYCADLAGLILKDEPDMVVCAGWMMVLSPTFLDPLALANIPVINLHPALPGKYDGIRAIERAHEDFTNGTLENDRTGIMVHYVISEVDRGQPILVREVQIIRGEGGSENETVDALTERIHEIEHEVIVAATGLAIARLWEGRRA